MDGQDEEVIDRNNNYNNNNNNDNLKKDTEKDIEGDVEEGGGQQSIVKRKRTRREKRQSPTPLRMIATSTNSSKSDQDSDICSNNNMVDDNITTAATTTATTTTTTITIDKDRENTNIFNNIVTTKEEEEVAKCLILLAQSHPCPSQPIQNFSKSSGRSYNNNNNDNNSNDNNNDNNNGTKFISRKFMEASSSTGKFGYYVYECKTCGKNFTSFQALGGHRASHKKPKYNKDEDYNNKGKSNQIYSNANSSRNTSRSNYITNLLFSSDDEDPPFKLTKLNNNSNNNSTSLSLQLANRSSYSNCITNHQSNNKRSRVHECSICGSEFTSGQALGGHMRRHRGLVTNNLPIAATPLTIEQPSNDVTQIPEDTMINTTITMAPPRNIKRSNSALSVDLDLNLPAPSEDNLGDDHQKEFKSILESNELPDEQSPSTQQVVLSSSSIVDCDY